MTDVRALDRSCVASYDGCSLVIYGASRDDLVGDPAVAVAAFLSRGVEVGDPGDVTVLAGRLVPPGLPPRWYARRRGVQRGRNLRQGG